MDREKGVALIECSECGEQVPAETQPDGSLVAGECPNCKPSKQKASKRTSREKATNVEEGKK